jgi:hypothetical protein
MSNISEGPPQLIQLIPDPLLQSRHRLELAQCNPSRRGVVAKDQKAEGQIGVPAARYPTVDYLGACRNTQGLVREIVGRWDVFV